jgi:hypothetical protein
MTSHPRDHAMQSLLESLARELFQTETSATSHCGREAKRLGSVPPAFAMQAVAEHAETVLRELPAVAEAHGVPVSGAGVAVGQLFSELRDKVFDKLIRSERSYRGTLLGMRHGVDLVQLLERAAQAAGDLGLAHFCQNWLQQREPLVQRAEQELTWFAEHPEEAMKRATVVAASGVRRAVITSPR